MDTKQKELGGDFANGGRVYHPQGAPEPVHVPDLLDKHWGTVIPDGVYALTHNGGWGSVGVDHETAACAVATVQPWWQRLGSRLYPQAQQVLLTADGGGSHSSRARLWQVALQKLSDTTGLEVHVGHFPPGTSQWHTLEQRVFCHITENWRGRPLVSQEGIVNLSANTTTEAELRVEAAIDPTPDETGQKVSDAERAKGNLYPADVHGTDGNYVIKPRGNNQ